MIHPPSHSARFVRNVGWTFLGQSGLACLTFYLIPYLVRSLGTEGYAIYSLMGALSGYLILLTLGSGTATVKLVSELRASGRHEELSATLGLALWIHIFMTALGVLASFPMKNFLAIHLFQVSTAMQQDAIFVFGCAILAAVSAALISLSIAVWQGMQRFDMASLTPVLQSAMVLGGSALLILYGRGLRAIGQLYVSVQIFLCLAAWLLVLKSLPVRPAWRFWEIISTDTRRRFVSYALASFLGQFTWSVAFQLDRVFIGHLRPLSELTYYLIPSTILQKFMIIPATISSAAFPILSELHGQKDQEAIRKVYTRCSQLILWLTLPGFVLLLVLAPQLLTLWLGEPFSLHGTWPLRLLCLGYLVYFMATMPGMAYLGTGNVRYGVYTNIALASLCCLFWRLLIPKIGIAGAALGFLSAEIIAHAPFIYLVNRDAFDIPLKTFLNDVCRRPFGAAGLLLLGVWLLRIRLFSWITFLCVASMALLFYYGVGFWLLGDEERGSIMHLIDVFLARGNGQNPPRKVE